MVTRRDRRCDHRRRRRCRLHGCHRNVSRHLNGHRSCAQLVRQKANLDVSRDDRAMDADQRDESLRDA